MAWGGSFEIYVCLTNSKDEDGLMDDVAYLSVEEARTTAEVRASLKRLKAFVRKFEKAIEKHDIGNLCLLTNS